MSTIMLRPGYYGEGKKLPNSLALLIAILLQAALLAGLSLSGSVIHLPPAETVTELSIVHETETVKEEPVRKLQPIKIAPPTIAPPQVVVQPTPLPVVPMATPTNTITLPPVTPPAPSASTPASNKADPEVEFAARLRAAIQAALVYPSAVRAAGFQGKARVEFNFRDGTVRNPHIVQSTGMGMADRAALAAVLEAAYPPIPESLTGKDGVYQVSVVFQLSNLH